MKFKYCIIGTGIGGGFLLQNLSLKDPSASIAVIEAGGLKRKKENHYVNSGLPFKMITTSIQIGGTSNLWHGVLSDLDPIDFEKRDWIPNSGWPINRDELLPYYKEAALYWGVENPDYFEESKLNYTFKNALNSIPYNRQLLKNKLFQQPLKVKSLKNTILKIVQSKHLIKLYKESTALELVEEDNKIKFCKIGCKSGEIEKIEADIFILCAGALETPRIMLNSNCFKNDNIGKYLMDHPMGNLLQIKFKKPQKAPIYSDTRYGKGTKIKTGLVFTDDLQEKYKLPNHNFYIRPSFVKGIDDNSEKVKLSLLTYKSGKISFNDIWRVLTNLNVVRQVLTYKLSLNVTYKYADLFFLMEQVPSKSSFVGLSSEKDSFGYPIADINWNLTDYDLNHMKTVFKLCREEFFPSDHFNIIHGENDYNWDNILTSGAHHVGTARMSESEQNGVVDKNLKVHCKSNLYVCDGSIFPTSGNVNIGLTISAFAIRLSNFLTKH